MRNLQVFACSRLEEPGPKLYSSLPTFHAVPQLTELYLQGASKEILMPVPCGVETRQTYRPFPVFNR